jgi:hypothetical protein
MQTKQFLNPKFVRYFSMPKSKRFDCYCKGNGLPDKIKVNYLSGNVEYPVELWYSVDNNHFAFVKKENGEMKEFWYGPCKKQVDEDKNKILKKVEKALDKGYKLWVISDFENIQKLVDCFSECLIDYKIIEPLEIRKSIKTNKEIELKKNIIIPAISEKMFEGYEGWQYFDFLNHLYSHTTWLIIIAYKGIFNSLKDKLKFNLIKKEEIL